MSARRLVLLLALLLGAGCASAPRAPTPAPAAAPVGRPEERPAPVGRELEEVTRRLDAAGGRAGDLENALARLGARVEALERRLDQLSSQLAHARASRAPSAAGGELTPAEPGAPRAGIGDGARGGGAPIPGASATTARDLYQAGMAKYRAGELDAAVLIFYDLVARHPSDPLRESAQFQAAEIFFREKDYRGAVAELEDLLAAVPSGAKTADALLKVGLSYRALGDEASARRAWERLTREFPGSAASRQARTLLKRPPPR